jgi:hypothetical protein
VLISQANDRSPRAVNCESAFFLMRSPKSPPPALADYPNPPSTDPLSLDPHQQLLLVARHSPCLSDACTCHGWKPRSSKSTDCSRCGHDLQHHGMQEVEGLDEEEKERRIKVASRIDELLNVSGSLHHQAQLTGKNSRTWANYSTLTIQMKTSSR